MMWKIHVKYDMLEHHGAFSAYEPFYTLSSVLFFIEQNLKKSVYNKIIIKKFFSKKEFTFSSYEEAKETLNKYIILE